MLYNFFTSELVRVFQKNITNGIIYIHVVRDLLHGFTHAIVEAEKSYNLLSAR